MISGIQSLFSSAGKSACYFLAILELAERVSKKHFDFFAVLDYAAAKGYVKLDKTNYYASDNFYMNNPAGLLSFLTGKTYTATKENANYKAKEGELVVELYEFQSLTHFRLPDWDSLQASVVVNKGSLTGFRIFREVK